LRLILKCEVAQSAEQQQQQQQQHSTAATCCCGEYSICVCCLLIMIMMIEIVFSSSPLFGIFLCIYALPICSRLPSWWSSCLASRAVCVCRFAAHLFHFTRLYSGKNLLLLFDQQFDGFFIEKY